MIDINFRRFLKKIFVENGDSPYERFFFQNEMKDNIHSIKQLNPGPSIKFIEYTVLGVMLTFLILRVFITMSYIDITIHV